MPVHADIPKLKVQEAAIRAVGQTNLAARERMARAMGVKRLSAKERRALEQVDKDLEQLQVLVHQALHHLYDAFD